MSALPISSPTSLEARDPISELAQSEAARRISDERLRRLFDANIVGILIANNGGAIVEANDAFLAMIGYTREELEAGAIDWRSITPAEWLPLDEAAIDDLDRLGSFAQYEKEYVRKDGVRLPISVGGARISNSADEQICYIVDLSDIRRAEAALRESESRYRVLAEALPQIVMLADADRRLIYVNHHYEAYTGVGSDGIDQAWPDLIHPDDLATVRRARATGESYDIEFRLRRAADGAFRWHAGRTIKIVDSLGTVRWLATAIDIDDRKRAEDALRFIERAGSRLAQSLDTATTLETVLDLVVPDYGDWATVSVRDGDEIVTLAARHRDPDKAGDAARLLGSAYFSASHDWGTAAACRTGKPQIVSGVMPDAIGPAVKPEFVDLFKRLGVGSLVAIPIVYDDDVIGALSIRTVGERRPYSEADVAPLQELARRAGFAIAHARQYERANRVATVLQAAALPQQLPHVTGFAFDAYYQAGRSEALIGGDWFDAFALGDGRIVVSVGDVAGNGLDAAVLMGNMRQVLRAAAHLSGDPLLMVDIADRTLRGEGKAMMVTAFVGIIDPHSRQMTFTSAGHWPALLRAPDGTISSLTTPGLPIGSRDLGPGEAGTVTLPAGSCLLLYTDGLVEWSRDLTSGEAILHERFREVGGAERERPAKLLVERILGAISARDDIAVLTVSVRDPLG